MVELIIICAMEEETRPFIDALEDTVEVPVLGAEYEGPACFTLGLFEDREVMVVQCGIGTTNAAVATTAALEHTDALAVIIAGTTGGLGKDILTGDIVVADRALYHEANATGFGYAAGQIPRMPQHYEADPLLTRLAQKAAVTVGYRHHLGPAGSSNSFVTADLAGSVRQTFPDLQAVDMETAAIAQTCWLFGKPWVSVRAVSDLCAPEGTTEFHQHAPLAYINSFEAVRRLVEELAGVEEFGAASNAHVHDHGDLESCELTVTETGAGQVKQVRRALLSLSDKEGLVDLAATLAQLEVELIATSSTAATIAEAGVPVTEVSEVTGFPEILDGRVKTLHPAIHAGILARQDDRDSLQQLEELGIEPIDLVVANLYPFAQGLMRGVSRAQAIELIDIGGPTLIRAAAKNYASVAVITDPSQYPALCESLLQGGTTETERLAFATRAFQQVADYDIAIANWMSQGANSVSDDQQQLLPEWRATSYRKSADLRYGENPHQKAALYLTQQDTSEEPLGLGVAWAEQLGGKELSFNNLQDANSAALAADSFPDQPAVVIVKHSNPCGIAVGENVAQAYSRALRCDPLSAFGGVVATNREVDEQAALEIIKVFTEVVIANSYTDEALRVLRSKPNLRVLRILDVLSRRIEEKPINGGLLVQQVDRADEQDSFEAWRLVAGSAATEQQARDLEVAWKAAQFTKSNAIVLVRNQATIGIGMGQVNRMDSAMLAVRRANTLADGEARAIGSVAASDAFFPFADGLQILAQAGISAVVAPHGSIRDEEVVEAARQAGLTLYFAPRRHFWH